MTITRDVIYESVGGDVFETNAVLEKTIRQTFSMARWREA